MQKLFKTATVLFLILLIAAALFPVSAFAQGAIDPNQSASITVDAHDESLPLPGAAFHLYRVADVNAYADLTLTPDFEVYRSSVRGLSELDDMDRESWLDLASTLKGYVQRDELKPAASGITNENGQAVFSLMPGLYLLLGDRLMLENYDVYSFTPSMVFLPEADSTDNSWNYDITLVPKYDKTNEPPAVVTRKVIKVWDDAGFESIRPQGVTVQLLCDGQLYETQELNQGNNWRYTWDALEDGHDWQLVEKDLEHYTVSVTQEGVTFIVTNHYCPPAQANNPVSKRITGDKPKEDSIFLFEFTGKDVNNPMPAGSKGLTKEIAITGAGSGEFGVITFDTAGHYEYTVTEKNTGSTGYTYDTTIYTVSFDVSLENGAYTAVRTVKDNTGKTVTDVVFTNPYKTPGNDVPQTGLLWWPVPVLLVLGLAFVMIGVRTRRKNGKA